ncbi:hypothetical protein PR048_009086 [Dryococelus australis]|uniref:GIY-YIG domain-containing protein n=1 Tax=Dryococelus australis TaxID=614101 RepID=A0ABQ9HYX2_9NEOP|nr:hypothetical protein PR048_009086 [Dryococelus australis]
MSTRLLPPVDPIPAMANALAPVPSVNPELPSLAYSLAIYTTPKLHCNAEYIGLTTNTLRQRMNGHKADTKHAIAGHFNNLQDKPVAARFTTRQLDLLLTAPFHHTAVFYNSPPDEADLASKMSQLPNRVENVLSSVYVCVHVDKYYTGQVVEDEGYYRSSVMKEMVWSSLKDRKKVERLVRMYRMAEKEKNAEVKEVDITDIPPREKKIAKGIDDHPEVLTAPLTTSCPTPSHYQLPYSLSLPVALLPLTTSCSTPSHYQLLYSLSLSVALLPLTTSCSTPWCFSKFQPLASGPEIQSTESEEHVSCDRFVVVTHNSIPVPITARFSDDARMTFLCSRELGEGEQDLILITRVTGNWKVPFTLKPTVEAELAGHAWSDKPERHTHKWKLLQLESDAEGSPAGASGVSQTPHVETLGSQGCCGFCMFRLT